MPARRNSVIVGRLNRARCALHADDKVDSSGYCHFVAAIPVKPTAPSFSLVAFKAQQLLQFQPSHLWEER